MKKLYENWRRYLKEAEGVSPVTKKPYPAALPEKDKEAYDKAQSGEEFDPAAAGTGPTDVRKTKAKAVAGKKDIKTQMAVSSLDTVGDLRKAIKLAQRARDVKQLKGVVGDEVLALIPWFSAAKTVLGVAQGMIKKKDDKPTNTALDALNVDDEVSAIVDDTVEANFIKWVQGKLKDVDDATPLVKLDMDTLLQSFLKDRYNQRTIIVPKAAK